MENLPVIDLGEERILNVNEEIILGDLPVPYAYYSWSNDKEGSFIYESRSMDTEEDFKLKIKTIHACEIEDQIHVVWGDGLGLSEAHSSEDIFTISPNPAHNTEPIKLFTDLNGSGMELEIYDMKGRNIYHRSLSEVYGIVELSDVKIAPGAYFVLLQSDRKRSVQKLVVY